ncbi:MAG: lipoyl protein ligase domain-containing protein [Pseudanabaenaceae cyanobacterium]
MAYLEILPYLSTTGQQQMALDRWLLTRFCGELSGDLSDEFSGVSGVAADTVGCLRFYGWQPHAISLGYHQQKFPSHWQDLCVRRGLDLVQRPSGGRAVLHGADLTYALVLRLPEALQRQSRREIYEWLCGFLIAGLAPSGIELSFGTAGRGDRHQVSCFATATAADLVIGDGRKMIGSAQVYRQRVNQGQNETFVLQHGSIVLQPDHDLSAEIFGASLPVVGLLELLPQYTITEAIDFFSQQLTAAALGYFDLEPKYLEPKYIDAALLSVLS